MQSVSSRIWTRVAVSISYDDNHYTTGTFIEFIFLYTIILVISSLLYNNSFMKKQIYQRS